MSFYGVIRRLLGPLEARANTASPGRPPAGHGMRPPGLASHAPRLAAPEPQPWWLPRPDVPVAPGRRARPLDRRLLRQMVTALGDPYLELPQLPETAAQVLNVIRDEESDMRCAARFAARDPLLAAEFLRMANSAAFRGISPITRLDAAFVRLGQKSVRGVVLAATIRNLTLQTSRQQRNLGEELWLRFWASGLILAELSGRFGLAEDDAFLLGLLHDIGQLGVLKVVQEFQASVGVNLPRRLFDALAQRWHERLGARIASAWELPAPLPEVLGAHHGPPAADDPLRRQRLLVQLAEVICGLLDYAPYQPCEFFALPCVRGLGLADTPETRALLLPLPALLKERMQL